MRESLTTLHLQADVFEAIQALRSYFVDALHASTAAFVSQAGDAASALFAFVQTKHATYQIALCKTLQAQRSAKIQLAAVTAMMDSVRAGARQSPLRSLQQSAMCGTIILQRRMCLSVSMNAGLHMLDSHITTAQHSHLSTRYQLRAERVGAFSTVLYTQLLDSLLTSKHIDASVVSAFLSKYAKYADRQYFLLRWIAAATAKLAGQKHDAQAWQMGHTDAVLTLFDALLAVNTSVSERKAASSSETGAPAPMESWCGGVEAGVAIGAPLPHEGTKARKKRKLHEASSGGGSSSSGKVQWASPLAHRQAFRRAPCCPGEPGTFQFRSFARAIQRH
jgi:hypothetical protein